MRELLVRIERIVRTFSCVCVYSCAVTSALMLVFTSLVQTNLYYAQCFTVSGPLGCLCGSLE